MSRNIDKANSILATYQEQQAEKNTGYKDYSRFKRPKNVNKINSIEESNQWKNQVVREIKQKIDRMYDLTLNDTQLLEINDEINELIIELNKWNYHITNHLLKKKSNQKKIWFHHFY
ncbi:hypothetical protein TBLA_0B02120 [Henningerozyma blattae CBS 6284]|uniref:Pre-mRNA-splicing factor ISY1 n=1 Tax=Henningerozyma blattae (strain ATCC 34711 / CBS 6284 / DSM 70876 / NBRC 10599 / NRRL Y-10934 / UCD 77-7) TaxID=1071380 RepID=I2GY52_HENB6|nr:hypothetical protein TBLA_0B02120 [Tetrapisispora blattae CBS 6284]CCH59054.1 hypothetical protein TBLA_0B02120 [Tetrapisispora blattae CBS 6284]